MFFKLLRAIFCFAIIIMICQSESVKVQADHTDRVQKVRLVWEAVPDAVMYELVVNRQIEDSADTDEHIDTILVRDDIYTAGVELDVPNLNANLGTLWWQVRALNVDRQPLSDFSPPQKLEDGELDPLSPLPTAYLDIFPLAKLYPAYSWIPVLHAASYEVQVLSANPETSQRFEVVRTYHIDSGIAFDCYDEDSYTKEGVYWWRVLAKDCDNQPIGEWSQPLSFEVSHSGGTVALFGDSVTHGGGAISNPPSDPAYDLTSYAGVPIRNLGRSGDTVDKMVERFEQDVLPFEPQILVILGGINDIRAGKPSAEVVAELAAIKAACRKHEIIPVFITLAPLNPAGIKNAFDEDTSPDWQGEWQQVNQWIMDQEHHVDVAAQLSGPDGLLPSWIAADGLHPDTKGKAVIGQAVGAYLRQNFADRIPVEAQL